MGAGDKPIFRKTSLERLSTPDRLDQLVRVVNRRNWITLAGLGGVLLAALVWCFLGRIPITVEGRAVLVRPRQVVPVPAAAAGTVRTLSVQAGDTVAAGQVIATLDLPHVERAWAAEQARLETFRARARRRADLAEPQARADAADLAGRYHQLEARIERLAAGATQMRAGAETARQQVETLQKTLALTDDLGRDLAAERAALEAAVEAGRATGEQRREARERWVDHALRRAQLEVQIQDLRARELEALERHHAQVDLLATARADLERLGREPERARLQRAAARAEDDSDEDDILRALARLEETRTREGRLVADRAGLLLEVTIAPGATVAAGERVASLAADEPGDPLVALAYLDVADGQRMQAGMHARVAPSATRRERTGSILARVERVSPYPVTTAAVLAQVGNREMAEQLLGGRGRVEVRVALEHDAAGRLRWTSPPGAGGDVTPGTHAWVAITLEERAPITLLLPALRGWLGLD